MLVRLSDRGGSGGMAKGDDKRRPVQVDTTIRMRPRPSIVPDFGLGPFGGSKVLQAEAARLRAEAEAEAERQRQAEAEAERQRQAEAERQPQPQPLISEKAVGAPAARVRAPGKQEPGARARAEPARLEIEGDCPLSGALNTSVWDALKELQAERGSLPKWFRKPDCDEVIDWLRRDRRPRPKNRNRRDEPLRQCISKLRRAAKKRRDGSVPRAARETR